MVGAAANEAKTVNATFTERLMGEDFHRLMFAEDGR